MLTSLHIKNLALMEDASVELEKPSIALIGETGAGKSLIVESLSLLFGARADYSFVEVFMCKPQREQEKFIYQPGAVMCNLFLADEINRTSPKTQSALLEVMEENAVTVDGVTRPVPSPFVVIATENPIGYTGTQMLPESQLDRFQVCVVMGYPSKEDEITILKEQSVRRPLQSVQPVINKQ